MKCFIDLLGKLLRTATVKDSWSIICSALFQILMVDVCLFGNVSVGNSRDGRPVSLYDADVDFHALVHLSSQPACSSLEHLQVDMFILLPKTINHTKRLYNHTKQKKSTCNMNSK